jgi:hypothetical protein
MRNVQYGVEFVSRIAPDPKSGKIKMVIKRGNGSIPF